MTLEEYLAKGIAAYRAEMLKVDPEFFNRPENLVLYRDHQSNLTLLWEQKQATRDMREVAVLVAASKKVD